MAKNLEKIRNIGIMAHIDAGKTTVTERVLYYTGKIYKMGEVHDGMAKMDYLVEEQERGITITSAATKCFWKDCVINLIDTPGHVDFTAEVERSLRVLDGAVAVLDASEGVQAQTESVWRQGRKYDLPCLLFINKMDKVGADFEMTVDSIRDRLLANPVVVQIPIGAADSFDGIIDLVNMCAVHYESDNLGAKFIESEIDDDYLPEAEHYRNEMLNAVAEYDEELMEAFVHDETVTVEQITRAIRKAVISREIQPVFCGSALKNIGVQRLLDAVAAYLPSPAERPEFEAEMAGKSKGHGRTVKIKCDPNGSLVALAFKVTNDQHGDLHFLRIYQGTLKAGSRVLDVNRDKKENITRIFEMHANERKLLNSASAGDIVAVIGLKETRTGDTICDSKKPLQLESITFPDTVISMSIEPRSANDKMKLNEAMAILRKEDPTFKCKVDKETGQMIISGMGELHLEVLQHKLVREMKVNVRVGKPRVAYKETITKRAVGEGKFVKQTGGRGQYGHVTLEIEPVIAEDGSYPAEIEFENKANNNDVPKEYAGDVRQGAMDTLSSGSLGGYPVCGVKVTLTGGSFHPVDSSPISFEQAAAMAVNDALNRAGCVLLEPVMRVQVVVPEANFGAIQASLSSKRAVITGSSVHGSMRVIDASVPLAEMFGYSSDVRGLTAGRGTFSMEPQKYQKVPDQLAEKILSLFVC